MCDAPLNEKVVLEAELSNTAALRFYARMGFIRDKRLNRYYLNGSDAFRLKLLLPVGGASARVDGASDGQGTAADRGSRGEEAETEQRLQNVRIA